MIVKHNLIYISYKFTLLIIWCNWAVLDVDGSLRHILHDFKWAFVMMHVGLKPAQFRSFPSYSRRRSIEVVISSGRSVRGGNGERGIRELRRQFVNGDGIFLLQQLLR